MGLYAIESKLTSKSTSAKSVDVFVFLKIFKTESLLNIIIKKL